MDLIVAVRAVDVVMARSGVDIVAVADPVASLNINATTGHYFTQVTFTDGETAPTADTDSDGFVAGTFEGWTADAPRQIEVRNNETSTTGGNWHIEIDDDPANASVSAIEVIVTFEDDSRRWCFFFTPEALASCGYWVPGTQVRYHVGVPHMIVVSEINERIVEEALRALDHQGELISSTLAI